MNVDSDSDFNAPGSSINSDNEDYINVQNIFARFTAYNYCYIPLIFYAIVVSNKLVICFTFLIPKR